MSDLIARLEAAEEGSRELDAEIAFATGWDSLPESGTGDRFQWCAAQAKEHDDPIGDWWPIDDDDLLPAYTTSLDAAMTLVPEGYGAVSGALNERGPSSMRIGHPYVFGNAATPALALVIAALRARKELKGP